MPHRLKVVRTLKFNRRWAAKLEKQKARREAREQAKREREAAAAKAKQEQEERAKLNPFAAPAAGAAGGLGGMLFGNAADNPFAAPAAAAPAPATDAAVALAADESDDDSADDDDEESESESESERLAEELALKSDLAEAAPATGSWVEDATRYPALYLNTVPEPSSSSESKKLSKQEAEMLKAASQSGAMVDVDDADLKGFAKEGYEKMLLDGIDDTFERFLKRVQVEPRQAVRYEFAGQPIAFHAKGAVYNLLWPAHKPAAGERVAVTKGQFGAGAAATQGERTFSARGVPPCPDCGAERVFEAQLMPNLINLLRAHTIQTADGAVDTDSSQHPGGEGEEDRKRAIEQALGRRIPTEGSKDSAPLDSRSGLVWSTAFIFVCSKDCVVPPNDADECAKHELILAQFEDEA